MALKSKSPSHEKANFAENPFEQLPRELLLPIVKLTSDLATLWSLSRVSRAVYSLIDDCGKEIVETVLNASEPKETRSLLGPIALLKLGMHPSTSLEEFKQSHVGTWSQISTTAIKDCYMSLPTGISSPVIHEILQTAYKISRLTPLCHNHFIDRCKNLEISEPIKLKFDSRYKIDLELSESRKYSVQDAGPPSWIEEKRISRGFWYIQMFYDLKNKSQQLRWTSPDLDVLRSMDTEKFYHTITFKPVQNAILTAALYLREAPSQHLVQSVQQSVVALQLPQPVETSSIILLPVEPNFEDSQSDTWGESTHCLDDTRRIPGLLIPRVCLIDPQASPRKNVPYYYYRRLGFAIWDRKRMFAFGLGNEAGKCEMVYNRREMIFKYLSILPRQ